MNRSVWSLGPPDSLSYAVNKIYQAKSGHEIDDVSGRCMQAFFVLADAINRAGAADPKKIQAALRVTDWPESAVFIGYRGVKFDATGQNILSATYRPAAGQGLRDRVAGGTGQRDAAVANDRVEGEGRRRSLPCGAIVQISIPAGCRVPSTARRTPQVDGFHPVVHRYAKPHVRASHRSKLLR